MGDSGKRTHFVLPAETPTSDQGEEGYSQNKREDAPKIYFLLICTRPSSKDSSQT